MPSLVPAVPANLFGSGQCSVPLPVATIIRRSRFYQTLNIVVPASGGDGAPSSKALHSVVAPPSFVMLALAGREVNADTTAIDLFGGAPIGATRAADVRRLEQPVLAQASVKNLEELATSGKVRFAGRSQAVELTADGLEELSATGKTVLRVHGNRLAVKLDAAGRAVRTEVIRVADAREVVREGCVRTAEGVRMNLALSARDARRLETGAPLAVKIGNRRAIVVPERASEARAIGGVSYDNGGAMSGRVMETSTPPAPESPKLRLILPFEETWELIGYERGELVSCVTLTPQEEATIEVFSWDRRRTSVDDTISSESESSTESQSMHRDTADMFNEMTKSGEFTWSANATVEFKVGIFNVGVETGGGTKQSTADIARTTQQQVGERTQKASERVKASRQTKITESAEFGSETRTTRRLRNPNLARAVTYNYFEVLRRYKSTIACLADEAGLVLLVDNPFLTKLDFSIDCIRHEELTLRKTLLDRNLGGGFEAARMLSQYDHVCDALCHTCSCPWDPAPSGDVTRAEVLALLEALAQAVVDLDMLVKSGTWLKFFGWLFPLDLVLATIANAPPVVQGAQWFRAWAFLEMWARAAPSDWRRLLAAATEVKNAAPSGREIALFAFAAVARTVDLDKLAKAMAPDAAGQFAILSIVKSEARKAYANIAIILAVSSPEGVKSILLGVVGILTGSLSTIFFSIFGGAVTAEVTRETIVGTVAGLVGERVGITSTDDGGLAALLKAATEAYAAMRTAEASADRISASDAKAEREARKAAVNSMFPPNKILHARERLEALQHHLLRYRDFYGYHVLMDLRSAGVDVRPPTIAALGDAVASTPMALIDGKIAYHVDLDAIPGARELVEKIVVRKDMPLPLETAEFTLQTPGLVVEPKLSSCVACDEFVTEGRNIELELRRQQAFQAEYEAARLKARLDHKPPLLRKEDGVVPPLTVRLESTTTKA